MIDNFNGVMLCRRPPPPPTSSSQKIPSLQKNNHNIKANNNSTTNSMNNDGTSFTCGTVPKPWGSNVLISEKSRVLSRLSKNDGALSRHKKWLRDMQEKREEVLRQKEEEVRLKEKRKTDFMERQARIRAQTRQEGTRTNEDEEQGEGDGEKCYGFNESYNNDDTTNGEASIGGKRSRPAWALTESDAKDVQQMNEELEEQEIMDFVDELNGDGGEDAYVNSFYDDMELRVLMAQLKDRISSLEKERNVDESRLRTVIDSELASLRSEKLNQHSNNNQHGNGIGCGSKKNTDLCTGMDNDDIQSIAHSVRTSNEGKNSVHSQKSMHMLVSKSHDRMKSKLHNPSNTSGTSALPLISESSSSLVEKEKSMIPPVIITHTEDDGARLAETKSLNKLPFKNRNPAL